MILSFNENSWLPSLIMMFILSCLKFDFMHEVFKLPYTTILVHHAISFCCIVFVLRSFCYYPCSDLVFYWQYYFAFCLRLPSLLVTRFLVGVLCPPITQGWANQPSWLNQWLNKCFLHQVLTQKLIWRNRYV